MTENSSNGNLSARSQSMIDAANGAKQVGPPGPSTLTSLREQVQSVYGSKLADAFDREFPTNTADEADLLLQEAKVAELKEWWAKQSAADTDMVAEKAVAYGSNSLTQLGRKLAQMQGREVSEEEAQELGCWVNLVQKVERLTDSVMRGERASDDTVTDAICYLTMIRRIRVKGSWPGV